MDASCSHFASQEAQNKLNVHFRNDSKNDMQKLHITSTGSLFLLEVCCLRNGFRQSCLWDSWEVCFEGTFHRLWQSNANRLRTIRNSYDSLFPIISHTIITMKIIKHPCSIFKSLNVADGGHTSLTEPKACNSLVILWLTKHHTEEDFELKAGGIQKMSRFRTKAVD